MANRLKICKGKKSDSSCTCDPNHLECQSDDNASKYERNTKTNANDTPARQNNECSPECTNCQLLSRLYILLGEIVENKKILKNAAESKNSRFEETIKPSKKTDEEISKTKDNCIKIPLDNNKDDVKKCKIVNVYNNNTGSNNLMLCDCDKTKEDKANINSSCGCKNRKEEETLPKPKESSRNNSQNWYSVGQVKKNQVDSACQCACSKQDSSTQDDHINSEEQSKKCNCTDSAVNTDMQNLYSSLINDPNFREAMKCMPCPNIVVLSNGCNCCSKFNTALERTSVTTNTSEIIVTAQKMPKRQESLDTRLPQDSGVTFENIYDKSRGQFDSVLNEEFKIMSPISNLKNRGSTSTLRNSNDKKIHLSDKSNTLCEDTTFIVPQDTDFTVAAAIMPKISKKKQAQKSKKKKSKVGFESKESSTEKKSVMSNCCQTSDKYFNEEKCEAVLKITNKLKDAAICCDLNKCNALAPKLDEKDDNAKNTVAQNQNVSCNCKDIQNFVKIITEVCAQMNKSSKEKSDEIVECECNGKTTTSQETPVVNNSKDDCLEIHRLAAKIAEIHLKSNHNKSGLPDRIEFRRTIDPVKYTNSDCDLTNCININPIPLNNEFDDTEECYCKVCPCKKIRKEGYPSKKDKRGRSLVHKRIAKKINELECPNLNKWTQQFPAATPENNLYEKQNCTCRNYECLEETEIDCLNYNTVSDYSKNADSCQMETCPQLHRIIKDCMCGTKNCYCHNAKLNEIKTTAKLERLADQVINTATPCNCNGQNCTCANPIDPGIRKFTTRQVCFSSIYHENQQKIINNSAKEKKLFDKDVNGNPCLNGSKSETNLYIKNLFNTKPMKNKHHSCLKKVIPSTKKLKPFIEMPLLPIPDTQCTQINCINYLFPEIYQALTKIKQLTNWESLPQEIVEMVIDKILKREIKCALQQMKEGVIKMSTNGGGDKQNSNILNILLEDKIKSEENFKGFKNNVLDKFLEKPNQTSYEEKNIEQYCNKEKLRETINLSQDNYNNNNNIQDKLDSFDLDQKNVDLNKKPILVQINIEKEKKSRKCSTSMNSSSQKEKKVSIANSCASLNENTSASPIYITENKLSSIKDLITLVNNNTKDWEDVETVSSSMLSLKEENQPISININIEIDKDTKLNLKDSGMNTDKEKMDEASIFALSKEDLNKNMRRHSSRELKKVKVTYDKEYRSKDESREKNKSNIDFKEKIKFNMDLQLQNKSNIILQKTTHLADHKNQTELPFLDDFLAMNNKMKVEKIKIEPKNIYKY